MKSCFVISPIGLPGSEIREHADDVFDFIIKPAAEKAGYAAVRADHEARPGTITEQMYDHILGDDLLIAILTGHNPNVFYEVAVAEAAARPLILLIENGHDIPFDISARRVLQYDLKPRALNNGTHIDGLFRSITELETSGGNSKVPFRPSLKPLGAGTVYGGWYRVLGMFRVKNVSVSSPQHGPLCGTRACHYSPSRK
jgi:hypothetical protein